MRRMNNLDEGGATDAESVTTEGNGQGMKTKGKKAGRREGNDKDGEAEVAITRSAA